MGTIAYTVPQAGTDLNSIADPEIATALTTLKTAFNGNIDAVNLSALLAQAAGVNQSGQTVKGAVNIATTGTRTNTAYGALSDAADQVTGIVLPTNGLIAVSYHATWKESAFGVARAAIFIGSNQLQLDFSGTTGTQAARTGSLSTVNQNDLLATCSAGLFSLDQHYFGDATTGQVVGMVDASAAMELGGSNVTLDNSAGNTAFCGPCLCFAAAGTYTVSVQFKASSGTVTALNRKLWVQALSFG